MQLVQMRGETQYNIPLLCNLCRRHPTCADEEWNSAQYSFVTTCADEVELASEGWNWVQCSFVMQLVQMRGGTQYNILYNLCK